MAQKVWIHVWADEFEYASAGSPETLKRNNQTVVGFDAAAVESVIYGPYRMHPDYASGSDITFKVVLMAASATSGNVRGRIEVEYSATGAFDHDADGFATAVEVNAAADSVSGETFEGTFTLSNSNMDGVAAKGLFRFKWSRVGNDGTNDTMTGDAQVRDMYFDQAA